MKIRIIASLITLLFLQQCLQAQDDLLKGMEDSTPHKHYVTNAFKSSRVINGQSMEFIGAGVMDVRILHRFGAINEGISQFYGLDQATMRLGFDYGLGKSLTVGVGRSTTNKDVDGFIKYRPVWQATGPGGSPVSIVLVAGMSVQTYKNLDTSKTLSFTDRTGYYYQVIIGRKFTERFTLQLSPTLVHRNTVAAADENDIYAVGVGGRYKFSKHMAFVVDYFYVANGLPHTAGTNPLSVGVDIETGGHVFQLHFSNTSGMNERAFITETTNKWGKGQIQFGFNLSRVFTVKKKHGPQAG